ncbi:MAG: hypothetical protein IIU58_06735 [Clostridia bacterium]|nr:hypothetical protein [Clostridia bacterium]
MLPENELLQYVYKTADMGVVGIEAVLEYATDPALRKVLRDQMSEYVCCRTEAEQMLLARSEDGKGVNPIAKLSAQAMSVGKMMTDSSTSSIAEMTIQGNNMGVSKTLRHLRDYPKQDDVRRLTEQLLKIEQANIEQLKPFL